MRPTLALIAAALVVSTLFSPAATHPFVPQDAILAPAADGTGDQSQPPPGWHPPPEPPPTNISAACFAAIHDKASYRAVARSCVPKVRPTPLGNLWGAPKKAAVSYFKAAISYGFAETLMAGLYDAGGPLDADKTCWDERMPAHSDAYCSAECGKAFDHYFSAMKAACGGDVLVLGLGNYNWAPPPGRPIEPGSYADFARTTVNAFFFAERPKCPRVPPPPAPGPPGWLGTMPHAFSAFLLDTLDRREDTRAADLDAVFRLSRAALCATAPQSRDRWGDGRCPAEARQIVGPNGGLGTYIFAKPPPGEKYPRRAEDVVLEAGLLRDYFGEEGREAADACACAKSVLSALPPTSVNFRRRFLDRAYLFGDSMCEEMGLLSGFDLEAASRPPNISAQCMDAIHDRQAFKRVVDSCLPSADEREWPPGLDPTGAMFLAVAAYGTGDSFLRRYTFPGGPLDKIVGDKCWADVAYQFNDAYCSSQCGEDLESYLRNMQTGCGSEVLRPPAPPMIWFGGRHFRMRPPLWGGISTGDPPGRGCPHEGPPHQGPPHILRRLLDLLRNLLPFPPPPPPDPSQKFWSDHSTLLAFLSNVDDQRPLNASELALAVAVPRAAFCNRVRQTSDWWGPAQEAEGMCELEAWRVLGVKSPLWVDQGWERRPEWEEKLPYFPWPKWRSDDESCRCMRAIEGGLPEVPRGFFKPWRARTWGTFAGLVCNATAAVGA